MVDIASLAIQIDTSDVARAEKDLDRLGNRGTTAEKSAKKLGDAYKQASGDVAKVGDASKKSATGLDQLEGRGNAAERSAKKVGAAYGSASSQIEKVGKESKKSASSVNDLANSSDRMAGVARSLGPAVAGMITLESLRRAQQLSEEYTRLQARVERISTSAGAAAIAYSQLNDIARRSGSDLGETVRLWEALDRSLGDLGANDAQILRLTDTLQKIGTVGGSSAEEMNNALRQLGQGLASGVIRAEEFNSVLEGMPELAMQIAKGLGVPFKDLRQLMLDGKLTAEDVLTSLQNRAFDVDREFAKLPRTVAQAGSALRNDLGGALSELDKTIGASSNLANLIDALSKGIRFTAGDFTDQEKLNKLVAERAALEQRYEQAKRRTLLSSKEQAVFEDGLKRINGEIVEIQDRRIAQLTDEGKQLQSNKAATNEGLVGLREQAKLAGMSAIEREKYVAVQKLGANATAEERAEAEKLAAETYRLNEARKGSLAGTNQQAKALQDFLAQSSVAVTSANDMAAAYLKGASSVAELAAQQKVEEQLLKTGAAARAEVTKAINEQQSALDRLDIAELIAKSREMNADLKAQVVVYKESTKSVGEGAEAQRKYNIEKQVSAALAGKNASALSKETAELRKQLGIQEDIREELEAHKKIAGLIDSTATAQEKLNRRMEELNELMDYAKTPEQITAIQRAMKEAQDDASQWAQWTEEALGRVDGAFADAWKNIGDGFKSFSDGLKDAFKQMLAELAHMAITKPIIMQIGASLGIGGGTQGNNGIWGSLLGGGSGGGGGFNPGQLLQYAQTGYSLMTGVGPAALAGYQSGGIMGGLQGAAGYYGNLASSAWGTVSGWLGGSAAAGAGAGSAAGTGFGYGQSLVSGQIGNAAYAGAQAGAGSSLSGIAGNLGAIVGPIAGLYMAIKGYGAISNGYDFKPKDFDDEFAGVRLGAKVINAYENGITKVFGDSSFLSKALRIPVATIGGLMSSVFGGGWETKNYGMAFSVANGDFLGQSYEDQKKKGGLFGSDKKRTKYRSLDPETAAVLQETFDATQAGVADLFASLSLTVEEGSLAGLQLARKKISTKGKTEEQIQEAIAEWFGTAAEAMNTELNKALETGLSLDLAGMQAFVANLQGVNEVIRYLNLDMFEASVAGGKLAESLAAVSGGLEALAQNSQTYYDAFFTEAEKVEDTVDAITRAFESADVTLAGSRAEYRAMVEDIDLTTEAGREMFATLMALSGQAATYYSIVEQQAAQATAAANAALFGAVDTAYAALQRSIAAQQQEIQQAASATGARISALTGVGNALEAALRKLRGTSDAAVRSLRAQSIMTLNSALVSARAGNSLAGFEGLQDALDTASQMDTALYSSLTDFEREQGRTANLIAELEKVNGKQLTVEQQVLKELDQQSSALNAQLEYAQSQLDALNGIDNSVKSVGAAVAAMTASVVAALSGMADGLASKNTTANNSALIDSVYKSVLGRETDEAGAAFWQQQLASGNLDYDQLAKAIAHDASKNANDPGAGAAADYLSNQGGLSVQDQVEAAYRATLGRSADAAGESYWMGQVSSGMSVADLIAAIERDAKVNGEIPGFAVGGYTGAGDKYDPAGIVHKGEVVWSQSDIAKWGGVGAVEAMRKGGPELEVTGPSRIYNASQTAAMLGGGDSTAAITSLQRTVEGQSAALRSIAKHTMQTAKRVEFLERWDFDGLPKERATA